MKRYDAVVVGAGHNGLVAAAYLAKNGLSTLVLERSDRIGGACVTTELIPGQVRLLRSLLLGREGLIERIVLASETDGTYVPKPTPKPTARPSPTTAP